MSSHEITDTRERILEHTRQLMEQAGGQGVRVADIAQAAGVSRQAVYMHFGSRSELLVATVRYVDQSFDIESRMRPIFAAQNGIAALEQVVIFWANYIPDIYGIAKSLLALRETDEAGAAAWQDRMDELYTLKCRGVVLRLQEEGSLSEAWTVDEATDFFWATIALTNWENLTIERGWSSEQYIERIQQVLKSVLIKPAVLQEQDLGKG